MIAYQNRTLPFSLNPYDYDPLFRPLWEASRAHMGMITPCRLWAKTKPKPSGYAVRNVGGRKTKNFYVHRLAWQKAFGPKPKGFCICHFCDRKLCTNPHHLFLGTNADNNADMIAKGRARYPAGERHGMYGRHLTAGEKNGRHKLTWNDIPVIRLLAAAGRAQRSLAKRYGVGDLAISRVVRGKRWCESETELRAMEQYWERVVTYGSS
jgi:hypothetical protein